MLVIACLRVFILLNDVILSIYAKLELVVGMTKQISDSKGVDIAIWPKWGWYDLLWLAYRYIYLLIVRYLYNLRFNVRGSV